MLLDIRIFQAFSVVRAREYIRFLLCIVIMFYSVSGSSELINTEPWLAHLWSQQNLVLCVSLFKDTICKIHC